MATYRPTSDVSAPGWSSTEGTLAAAINETTADDASYITSPDVASPTPYRFNFGPLPSGEHTLRIRARRVGAAGEARLVLLDSGAAEVGASDWQALTDTWTTYPLTAVASAVATMGEVQVRSGVVIWTPATLFANGEQGVWYDPSDMSTMFQDAAGTTPVTAVEQPVGRILDKSGRGNHATQTTATSRPVLSARVNLLTATETLATQTVTTLATTQTLRFEGAGTVTLSGTATGTYSAGSHRITTTAGNLTLTVSGTVTKADLRATNMGVGLPAYQRVNTATDYDTAGFPHYLRFDGVDDWLVTPSIDFTGTDKMTVFAGFRKLSSTTQSIVANKDTDAAGPAFGLFADTGSTNVVRAFSGGTVNNVNITSLFATGLPAPLTLVSTFTGDIAADINRIRINGVLAAETFVDQGSGNHANLPLFIGTNPIGTSRRFNGHIYSLIVRGAQSTAQQIASAETWVNGKTGAY